MLQPAVRKCTMTPEFTVAAHSVNIIILDDYQDAVRKLKCASMLENLSAKVFTNNVKGIGQLAVRLRDADVLVLICTHLPVEDRWQKITLLSPGVWN